MKAEDKEKDIDEQTMDECKILYCTKSLPMTESTMCWGWECGQGWFNALHEASCQLEALNILYYPKWKVRIQMDQVKEKFGTLHAYFSIVCDNYNILGRLGAKLKSLCLKIKRKVSFGMKSVIDQEAYVTDETEELTREEYDSWKKNNFAEQTLREENGKYYRDYKLHHCAKMHYEPTKHKAIYKLNSALESFAWKVLLRFGSKEMTDEQKTIAAAMNAQAEKIVRESEKACYDTCEDCGCQIGSKWSPRCQTEGWISYLCERCADKTKSFYYKNGAKWQEGEQIMTREEVEAARKEIEDRIEEKQHED